MAVGRRQPWCPSPGGRAGDVGGREYSQSGISCNNEHGWSVPAPSSVDGPPGHAVAQKDLKSLEPFLIPRTSCSKTNPCA